MAETKENQEVKSSTGEIIIRIVLSVVIVLLLVQVIRGFILNTGSKGNSQSGNVQEKDFDVQVGDTDISEYIIVCRGAGTYSAAKKLQNYIYGISGEKLKIGSSKSSEHHIFITRNNSNNATVSMSDGEITISGKNSNECMDGVYLFANEYLGWAFAGEDREHILTGNGVINIPENAQSDYSESWIEEREPIICLWDTDTPRGQYYNTDASLASEIMSYSDDQLYDYVRMMKYCGYTGIQVTDMCSTWAAYGGYEFVQQRIRFMADAAHSLDMNFTLWVWGAEFTGYGWTDSTVVYYDFANYSTSYECPEAVATFDKYYSIYAELADCCDRVIMHFDDPSNIHDTESVAYYAQMLRDKFTAVNPDVNFGISDYTDRYDKTILAEKLGKDFTVYSGADTYGTGKWTNFRVVARDLGLDYGVWSWYLCEMEIDQLAEMNVNASVIKEVYLNTLKDDEICKPTYWSEMDSYHVLNIFSQYCAAQLLINPEQDENELLRSVAQAVAGDEYADDFYEILDIIQDARSGNTYSQFKYSIGSEDYLLTSDAYDAEDIYTRCEKYYPILEEMIDAEPHDNTMPLPISVTELLKLIRSHLKQIMEFAEFRLGLEEIEADYENGASTAKLQKAVESLYSPISNYDCVVGVWGNAEALAQYKLLNDFCNEAGLVMPEDDVFNYHLKQYMYEEMVAYQKEKSEKLLFPNYCSGIWSGVLGEEKATEIMDMLIDEGIVSREDSENIYITDWETYVYLRN